jgi:hypothetical protein
MSAGVKISENNRTYLRQAVATRIASFPSYQGPMLDMAFRDPGKVQFLAALDHHEDGKPRDIRAPRYASPLTLIHLCVFTMTDEQAQLFQMRTNQQRHRTGLSQDLCPLQGSLVLQPGVSESQLEKPQAHLWRHASAVGRIGRTKHGGVSLG